MVTDGLSCDTISCYCLIDKKGSQIEFEFVVLSTNFSCSHRLTIIMHDTELIIILLQLIMLCIYTAIV